MVSRAAEILQSIIDRNIRRLGLRSFDEVTSDILFPVAPDT